MKSKYIKIFFISFLALIVFITACTKDLNTIPIDPKVTTSATVYKDANAYREVLAKCYAGLAVSGQTGPAGNADISGIDEGFSQYLRQYWLAQELTTDEAVIAWNDGTLKNYHEQNWTPAGEFITAIYNRIYYQVSLCNEFIREATDAKIDARGITGADKAAVQMYRTEARFLRALSYYHAIDLFGNVPFVDENNSVGAFFPVQKSRADLYTYIESELLDIQATMAPPRTNEYGRADQAAAWMLLAKLYQNASVYISTDKSTDVLTYVNKVIAAGYTIDPVYANMFLADNNKSPEIIFPITFDGIHTKGYGGTTFIVHAEVGGSMVPAQFGLDGGWAGNRVTSAMVDKFSDPSGATDKRAMFYTAGQAKAISSITSFTDGYAVTKWKNITSTGAAGSNPAFTDTDFPVFRLADAYLMYAEAVKRGGTGGDLNTALTYINTLRTRAYAGSTAGNLASTAAITLDLILDERARELYWECWRRTDLIRFGKFSNTTYLWPWKGGVAAGVSTDSHYDLFPIPSSDIGANPNLVQNPGY